MNDIQISKNFKLREFECKDGSHLVKLDKRLVQKLQELRDKVGVSIEIVSGYRTPEYNKRVGGAPKSQHMEGKAADIHVKGMKPVKVAELAEVLGFNGIGIYDTFTHIDVRDVKANWDFRGKKGDA